MNPIWVRKIRRWLAKTWIGRWLASSSSWIGRWLANSFRPPPFDQEPAYAEAIKWLEKFTPLASAGYDKALEYAWKRFDQVCSASEALDKKADNMLRNAGLVAGLLGVAMNTVSATNSKLLIPSLVLMILSLVDAAIACAPCANATSASVRDMLKDIGAGHASDAWISASLHCAIIGRNTSNGWKASRIRWATIAFGTALVFFGLPVLALFPAVRPYVPSYLL